MLQGAIGALMLPQGLGLIKEMFPPKEMSAAFGLFGPIMGLSAVGGPILAGWLIDADLWSWGWRTIFAINIPIGLLALGVGLRVLPPNRPNRSMRLDLGSAVLAASAMAAVVYPLVQGRELGWPAWTYALMGQDFLALPSLWHASGNAPARGDRPWSPRASLASARSLRGSAPASRSSVPLWACPSSSLCSPKSAWAGPR